jgi:hypothetical protein
VHLVLEADRFLADLDERAPDLDNVAGRIGSDVKVAKSAGRKAKSAVWNKGPISIDLRTVGVELEISTCFLANGV